MLKYITLVFLAVATVVPCYIKYRILKRKFEYEILFKQRHNCVVMYAPIKGMSGWPPYKNRVCPNVTDKNCFDILYEPFIFFINSSSKTLDIAYMMITIQKIYDALIEAHKRGVRIRLLMNFDHNKGKSSVNQIRKCIKEGIDVKLYVCQKPNMESIMHYKYMLKDYEEDGGYILIGSMNLTQTAFFDNYEDIVFTSETYLAKLIHDNFVGCWEYVETENQTLINKMALLDANLI